MRQVMRPHLSTLHSAIRASAWAVGSHWSLPRPRELAARPFVGPASVVAIAILCLAAALSGKLGIAWTATDSGIALLGATTLA
ncbi:MAG TPA: hypothetical protein VIL01_03585 [Thermomicrobiales bacterium]